MIRWTAVVHSVLSEGSFCGDTFPVVLRICHSASTMTGLIRRSQPERRQPLPRVLAEPPEPVTLASGTALVTPAGLPFWVSPLAAPVSAARPLVDIDTG